MMQATSRESLAAVRERFNGLVADADSAPLRRLGEDLSAVAALLDDERVLRRHLADHSASEPARVSLADGVFGGKVDELTMELLRIVIGQRWSRTSDLVGAVEWLSQQAPLVAAERAGTVDDVEDELFRFGRVLQSDTRLRELLGDSAAPVEGRVGLLDELLGRKVTPVTMQLLTQAIRVPRGRSLEVAVEELAELAASRRDRSVAQVTAAAPLSLEQEDRLADVLSRIYRRTISVQVEVDPEVVGGLVVRVGDEIVDGSIAARLNQAARELPH